MMNNKIKTKILIAVLMCMLMCTSAFCATYGPDAGNINKDFLKKHSIEEWNKLDDDTLEIDEIPLRIEFFSPTYLTFYNAAFNTIQATMRANGADDDVVNSLNDTSDTLKDTISVLKLIAPQSPQIALLEEQKKTLDGTAAMLHRTLWNMYLLPANANQLAVAKYSLCKGYETAFTSYKLLEKYELILEKTTKMLENVNNLTKNNIALGLATEVDSQSANAKYVSTKAQYEGMKAKRSFLKRQIVLALGFSEDRLPHIEFKEPAIDFDYLLSIDRQKDNEAAYNSNATYRSAKIDDFGKAGGLKGQQRLAYRDIVKEKVILEMDKLYADIEVKHKEYDAALVATKILVEKIAQFQRKKANGLLSNTTDMATEISISSDDMAILQAKYNFINAISAYKYGTLGVTTVN